MDVDPNINRREIATRRLQIAVEMGVLAESDCGLRMQLLAVEAKGLALQREAAELDFIESGIPPRPNARQAKE